jgi:hypothetical protein
MARILLVAATVIFLASGAGCRGDDGDDDMVGDDDDDGDDDGVGETTTIYDLQSPDVAEGTEVTLKDVVVVAIDNYGSRTGSIYVAEQEPHADHGRAYGGVLVFLAGGAAAELVVGDLVDIEGGVKDEFAINCDQEGVDCADTLQTLTEVSAPMGGEIVITKVGQGAVPEPEIVDPATLSADPNEAEKWESVLMRFENVAVLSPTRSVSESDITLEEMLVTGPFRILSDLTDLPEQVEPDQCFASVTGLGSYFFNYRLLPRSADDLVDGGSGCTVEQGAELCGDGMDNDSDGFADCQDNGCGDIEGCTAEATIVQIQDGTIKVDQRVELTGVVVTAIDLDREHLWVQDAGGAAPYNGVYLYRGGGAEPLDEGIAVGSVLDVSGRVAEYFDQTQVAVDTLTATGTAEVAVLTGVLASTVADPEGGEQYEGVLVELMGVPVLMADAGFGTFTVGDAATPLTVDPEIFAFEPPVDGTCFGTLRGVLGYSFEKRVLYPRSQADMTVGSCP